MMGAYEGAGITVLAKGVDFHGQVPWNDGTENGAFPTGTTLLTGVVSNPRDLGQVPRLGDANPLCEDGPAGTNPFPSNFILQPVEHRRVEHHQQLPGRRRHLRARLDA